VSATEVVEQFRKLSADERRKVIEQLREEFACLEPELTSEDLAELDRRAEDALKNPGSGIPLEQIEAEMKQRFGWT
jgi:putative addiction module component (TIGR02574 family)